MVAEQVGVDSKTAAAAALQEVLAREAKRHETPSDRITLEELELLPIDYFSHEYV